MTVGDRLLGSCTQFAPPLPKLTVSDPHGLYGSGVAVILICIPGPVAQRTRVLTMTVIH